MLGRSAPRSGCMGSVQGRAESRGLSPGLSPPGDSSPNSASVRARGQTRLPAGTGGTRAQGASGASGRLSRDMASRTWLLGWPLTSSACCPVGMDCVSSCSRVNCPAVLWGVGSGEGQGRLHRLLRSRRAAGHPHPHLHPPKAAPLECCPGTDGLGKSPSGAGLGEAAGGHGPGPVRRAEVPGKPGGQLLTDWEARGQGTGVRAGGKAGPEAGAGGRAPRGPPVSL